MREWLKDIREKAGYSTYKAAELSGISQSYYYAIEAGERGKRFKERTGKAERADRKSTGADQFRFHSDDYRKCPVK